MTDKKTSPARPSEKNPPIEPMSKETSEKPPNNTQSTHNTPPSAVAHGPNETGQWHDLLEHLLGVSERAAAFAEVIHASEAARLIGFWHDVGKLNPAWQVYLRQRVAGQRVKGPEHAIVAFKLFLDTFPDKRYTVLAYLMDCHHRGLKDIKEDFKERKNRILANPWIQQIAHGASQRFHAHAPLHPPPPLPPTLDMTRSDTHGRLALGWRLLHSCLVDADCLDTEAHAQPEKASIRQHTAFPSLTKQEVPPNAPFLTQETPITSDENLSSHPVGSMPWLLQRLQASQTGFLPPPQEAAPQEHLLYNHRQEIYRDALDAAAQAPGFFSMTVPTGGGKTRSSMAFALSHAAQHALRRVIVAIPYTSIIEQNASIYREIFGSAFVLEHHSNRRDQVKNSEDAENSEEIDALNRWQRLAAENWEAPIIVTTNVQLFESLFACKNSKLRKLHNIPRSVIILDEAQMLPTKLLAPTLDKLRALVQDFGCSVVFCTATQPAFSDSVLQPSKNLAPLANLREIIRDPQRHFKSLERVRFSFPAPTDARWSFEDLKEKIAAHPRSLTILNTIKDTHTLLENLSSMKGIFYLSSRLCPLHRSLVLQATQAILNQPKEPCRLIATQLVEAGVDLDFPVVFRVLAPLDSLIQAAGRCNREARLPYGETHVFDLQGSHTPKGIYSTATDQTRVMLQRLQPSDLHEPSIFQSYFRRLYNTVDTDRLEIQKSEQSFDFVQSAEKYRIIPEDTRPIFVHPLDLQRVLQPLREEMLSKEKRLSAFFDTFDLAIQSASNALSILQHTPTPPAAFLRTLQPFLVQLYQHSFFQAQQRQLIQHIAGDLYLWQGRYDALLGLVEEVDSTHLIFS